MKQPIALLIVTLLLSGSIVSTAAVAVEIDMEAINADCEYESANYPDPDAYIASCVDERVHALKESDSETAEPDTDEPS